MDVRDAARNTTEGVLQAAQSGTNMLNELCLLFLPDITALKMKRAYQVKKDAQDSAPFLGEACGCLLLLDISGYTKLTETFAARDPNGVQHTVNTICSYVNEISKVIIAYDGDILNFAGDAILAFWRTLWPFNFTQESAKQALLCALKIREKFDKQAVQGLEDVLRIKMALTHGTFDFLLLGDQNTPFCTYVIVGEPVQRVCDGEHLCEPGDIIKDDTLLLRYPLDFYFLKVPGKPKHERLIGCIPWLSHNEYMATNTTAEMKLEFTKEVFTQEAIERARVDEEGDEEKRVHERERLVLQDSAKFSEQLLWQFMMKPVRAQIADCQSLDLLNGLRDVTIMFLRVLPKDGEDYRVICESYDLLIGTINAFGGLLNKVTTFDKGMSFLIVFGLPGSKLQNESANALLCASVAKTQLEMIRGVKQVSIGIARGRCFSGIFGSQQRMEFTVIGRYVNIAARIMMAYPGVISCAEAVRLKAGAVDGHFRQLETKPLKGILERITALSFDANETPSWCIAAHRFRPIGRQQVLRTIKYKIDDAFGGNMIQQDRKEFLDRAPRAPQASLHTPTHQLAVSLLELLERHVARQLGVTHYGAPAQIGDGPSSACETDCTNFLLVLGDSGTGKSRVLDGVTHALERSKLQNSTFVRYKVSSTGISKAYNTFKSLIAICLNLSPYCNPDSLLHAIAAQIDAIGCELLAWIFNFFKPDVHSLLCRAGQPLRWQYMPSSKLTKAHTAYAERAKREEQSDQIAYRVLFVFFVCHLMHHPNFVIFLIDDAQFIDKYSWPFINALCTHKNTFAVLTADDRDRLFEQLTYALCADLPFARVYREDEETQRSRYVIKLTGLVRSKIGELICISLGVESIPSELESFIAERSSGYPGRIRKLLTQVIDEGYVEIRPVPVGKQQQQQRGNTIRQGTSRVHVQQFTSLPNYDRLGAAEYGLTGTYYARHVVIEERCTLTVSSSALIEDELLQVGRAPSENARYECVLTPRNEPLAKFEPPGLQDDILSYLDTLSPTWLTVVRTAAAIGPSFNFATLDACVHLQAFKSMSEEHTRSLTDHLKRLKLFACTSCTKKKCRCNRLAFVSTVVRDTVFYTMYDDTKERLHFAARRFMRHHLIDNSRIKDACDGFYNPLRNFRNLARVVPLAPAEPDCSCSRRVIDSHLLDDLIIHSMSTGHFPDALHDLADALLIAVTFDRENIANRYVKDIVVTCMLIVDATRTHTLKVDYSKFALFGLVAEQLSRRKAKEEEEEDQTTNDLDQTADETDAEHVNELLRSEALELLQSGLLFSSEITALAKEHRHTFCKLYSAIGFYLIRYARQLQAEPVLQHALQIVDVQPINTSESGLTWRTIGERVRLMFVTTMPFRQRSGNLTSDTFQPDDSREWMRCVVQVHVCWIILAIRQGRFKLAKYFSLRLAVFCLDVEMSEADALALQDILHLTDSRDEVMQIFNEYQQTLRTSIYTEQEPSSLDENRISCS